MNSLNYNHMRTAHEHLPSARKERGERKKNKKRKEREKEIKKEKEKKKCLNGNTTPKARVNFYISQM